MANKTYNILVNAKTQQAIGGINGLTGALKMATAAAGALGVGLAAKKFIEAGNAYTELQNKLRIVTTGQENLNATTRELLLLANKTRTPLQETATLYQRLAMGTEDMGLAQTEVLQLTGNINKALKVSGANAQETASVILQLSQAFRSGRLQGEEFRSISENGAVILDLLSESMGRTKGELKKLASEGKITAEVMVEALGGSLEDLDADFNKLNITLPEAFDNFGTAISTFTGIVDAKLGVTKNLAKGFDFLADAVNDYNEQLLAGDLSAEARANLEAKQAEALRKLQAEFDKTAKGARKFIESLRTADMSEYHLMSEKIGEVEELLTKGRKEGVISSKEYMDALLIMKEALRKQAIEYHHANDMQRENNKITRLSMLLAGETDHQLRTAQEALINKLRTLKEITEAVHEQSITEADAVRFRARAEETYLKELRDGAAERRRIADQEADEKRRRLEQQRDDFINHEEMRREEMLKSRQVELMLAGKTTKQAKSLAEFEMKTDQEKAQFAIAQATDAFQALGQFNKQAFQAYKAFAIAQAIQNTYLGASAALAKYPPPFSFIAAAAQVAAGLANVANIRNQTYSGRAGGGPVQKGQPYMVGESGRELFVPDSHGTILNKNQIGGRAVNVNFNIDATDADGFDDLLVTRKNLIVSMVRQAVGQGRL